MVSAYSHCLPTLPRSPSPSPLPMVVNRQPEPIIKVFVVDDLRVVREKLKSVLRSHQDIEVIGVAIDGYNAIEQLEFLQFQFHRAWAYQDRAE